MINIICHSNGGQSLGIGLKFSFSGDRGTFLSWPNIPSVASDPWDHLYFGKTPARRPRPSNEGMLNVPPKMPTELAKKTYEPRYFPQNIVEQFLNDLNTSVDMLYCKFWSFNVDLNCVDLCKGHLLTSLMLIHVTHWYRQHSTG